MPWCESRLRSGYSHSPDNKTELTCQIWLSWPLWLATPRPFWTDRAQLFCPSGSNLGPGPAIVSIPLESGIELHKSHFSNKIAKKQACGPQVEAKTVPELVKDLPSSAHIASRWSKMEPRDVIFLYFSAHLARLGPTISEGCFRQPSFSWKRASRRPKPWTCTHLDTKKYNSKRTDSCGFQHRPRLCATCSGPLHLIHLIRVTFISSDPLYYVVIRRRNNKSIY